MARSLQFAARLERVFERGVFHFGFAMVYLSRGDITCARAIAPRFAAHLTQTRTVVRAEEDDGQRRVDELAGEIGEVEARPVEDVCVAEGALRTLIRRQGLVHMDGELAPDVVEAAGARPADGHVDPAPDPEAPLDTDDLHVHPRRLERIRTKGRDVDRPGHRERTASR